MDIANQRWVPQLVPPPGYRLRNKLTARWVDDCQRALLLSLRALSVLVTLVLMVRLTY